MVGAPSHGWQSKATTRPVRQELDKYLAGKTHKVAKGMRKKYHLNLSKCEMCGAGDGLELHHIVPVMAGGTHDQFNVRLLCRTCHGKAESYLREVAGEHIDHCIPGGECIEFKHYDPEKRAENTVPEG